MTERQEKRLKEHEQYMIDVAKQFREENNFAPNEILTEEKLKYLDYKIKTLAMHKAIHSSALKEELLKNKFSVE